MGYKKKLPEKRIFIEGVPHFHCSNCNEYLTKDVMTTSKRVTYGVTRVCKECHRLLYGHISTRTRRSAEQLIEDDKIQKEFQHINLMGLNDNDRLEVKKIFKRLGYNDDEPIWIQFNRKHGF